MSSKKPSKANLLSKFNAYEIMRDLYDKYVNQ